MKAGSSRLAQIAAVTLVLLLSGSSAPVAANNSPTPSDTSSYYPGCPQWKHQVTFVNQCGREVVLSETAACYGRANAVINEPPFNGGRCWPTGIPGGSATLSQTAPHNTLTVEYYSCYSGNFGVTCSECTTSVRSQVEFTFDGGLTDDGTRTIPPRKLPGLADTYDMGMVDGFTVSYNISPNTSEVPSTGTCNSKGCNVHPTCPTRLVDGDACLSPNMYANANNFSEADLEKYGCVCSHTESITCNATTINNGCKNKYGCSPFSPPGSSNLGSACCPFLQGRDTPPSWSTSCFATTADRAWAQWAVDYITNASTACPGIYSWQYQDGGSLGTCQGNNAAMSYTITLCPKGS